ncbi:MAG TPA: glycosyltransferase family 87 protein [Burkholderiales bacterium]|nr:glycosyltransferase family 87 protein [Burkholderiales bacterium]
MTPTRDSAAARPGRYSAVTWAVVALALVLYYPTFSTGYGGTAIFLLAGDCMLQGKALADCSPGYSYPPFFGFFMIPLSLLPLWAGKLAWYGVVIATTYGCFRICETLTVESFGLTRKELAWVRLFTVILSFKFVMAVFANQAYDSLVFFFLLVGLYGLSKSRDFLGAFGLAAAAALKATPLLMLLYPLLHRKWKLFALGVVLCTGLSFLPDVLFPPSPPNAGYLQTWLVGFAGGGLFGTRPAEGYAQFFQGSDHLNQSLKTFVYRLVDPRNLAWGDFTAQVQVILYAVYVVYCLAALAIILRSAKMEGAHLWGASVVVISMLMLSPISSKSHFVALLLPYMAIVAYLLKHRELWARAVPLLGASFVLNLLASRFPAGRGLSMKMLSLGSITIATLLLLAVVAVIVFRRGKDAKPAG